MTHSREEIAEAVEDVIGMLEDALALLGEDGEWPGIIDRLACVSLSMTNIGCASIDRYIEEDPAGSKQHAQERAAEIILRNLGHERN